MTTINAHFDGRVFIPDEPVNLPVGTPLRVHVETIPGDAVVAASELLTPVIAGLDPALTQAIANDPQFAAENM